MITRTMHKFTTATAVLLTAAIGSSLVAQDPERNARPDQQSSSDEGLESIQKALKNLNQEAFKVLEKKSKEWGNGTDPRTDPTNRDGDNRDKDDRDADSRNPDRKSDKSGKTADSAKLKQDSLLIASSTDGLLVGAPTEQSGSSRGETATDRDRSAGGADADRQGERRFGQPISQQQGQGNNLAGMILFCSHDGESKKGYTAKDDRDSGAAGRAADASTGRSTLGAASGSGSVQPGVYAVKVYGDTVTLENESGRVVLTARIDQEGSADRMGGQQQQDRGTDRSGDRSATGRDDRSDATGTRRSTIGQGRNQTDQNHDWNTVFGAITKHVMKSNHEAAGAPAPSRGR